MGATFPGSRPVSFHGKSFCERKRVVLFAGRSAAVVLGIAYWAATRTSTGSGSSMIARVGLAKV